MVESDQITALEAPFGAFGLAVVSKAAVAAGSGALPIPYTEQDFDAWFVHQFWATNWRFNTSGASPSNVYEFDSKAMRKVEDGDDIVSMFENGNAAQGVQYVAIWRMLLLMG